MSHYPRIVVCELTGVAAVVRNAEEERSFHAAGRAPIAVALVLLPVVIVWLLWLGWFA